jgi:mannose-6-phosphate isomerase-like protein (cupin superfamily)
LRSADFAFSTAYLTHKEMTSTRPGVSSQVLVIGPAKSHRVRATSERVYQFWVTSGKVMIKMVGEEFEMGPDGMFWVEPDTICLLENRYHRDVKLHVNTMPSEF